MRRGGEDEIRGFHQEEARDGVEHEGGNDYVVFAGDGEGEEEDGYGQDGEEEEQEEQVDAVRTDHGEASYGHEEYHDEEDELTGVGGQKGTWGHSHDQVLAWDFGDAAAAARDGDAVLENCGGPEAIGEDEGACAIIDEAHVFKSDTSNVRCRCKCFPSRCGVLQAALIVASLIATPAQGVPLMDRVMIEALESVDELRKGSCLLFNHGVYKWGHVRNPPRLGNQTKLCQTPSVFSPRQSTAAQEHKPRPCTTR